jgi:hypothetical protein
VSGVKRAYGGSKSKGLRPFASRETRIARPSMGLPLCAARSGASAARCPKLLQANLSLRMHGCRSEHRRSRWPEGRGTGRAESTLGSILESLPAIRKKPALRAGLVLRKWAGLFAPSMGLTPPRCALRGQRYALSKFAPGKFVERGLPP